MKQMSKLVTCSLALALAAPMMTIGIFAETGSNSGDKNPPKTDVIYDNSLEIPDPEDPTNPAWAVKVPSSIVFTDKDNKVTADVELVSKNGGTLPTTDIAISVKSTNGYLLKLGTEDPIKYALEYTDLSDETVKLTSDMTNPTADAFIGLLRDGSSSKKVRGVAILQGTATKSGSHTDTLIYTVNTINT